MKLQITKYILLAQPEASRPHWEFAKGDVLETDNEYLIDRLMNLGVAKIISKEDVKEHDGDVLEQVEEKAVLEDHPNKMYQPAVKNKRGRKK